MKKLTDSEYTEQLRQDFMRDMQHAMYNHQKMNYHYLQYKGILWLNSIYGEEYLRTIGLQVHVPRTFMTIEAIRPYLSGRNLDIEAVSTLRKEYNNAKKAEQILKGEWTRSRAQWAKSDAEFYALLMGTGYLLSRHIDDHEIMPMYDGMNEDGTIKWKDGDFQRYKGMKLFSLNPWHTFPDHTATSENNWKHCFLYSIWDYETWIDYCKMMGFNTKGIKKGGILQEFDRIRRQLDVLYGAINLDLRTRDNGQLITSTTMQIQDIDMKDKIMVVEKFTNKEYSVVSGAKWTLNHRDKNPDPDKVIPIKPIRDYTIPDEFYGIGEAEVIRWQQYEENKVHNLAYMSILMNTVQRYGIVESMLVDPTEANFGNPMKWIHLKNIPGVDINKAIMPLNNQRSSNDVPLRFLEAIEQVRQEASGVSSYITSSPDSQVNTLGEANIMRLAGMERIREKIFEIEERDLTWLLKHWLVCIPQYYTDEMDLLLNDGENYYVKYLPYDREFNDDNDTVNSLSIEHGVHDATTIEEVYLKLGYKEVVFSSDLISGILIHLKTATSAAEKERIVTQLKALLQTAIDVNTALGMQKYDIEKITDELFGQFPDIFKGVDSFKLQEPQPLQPQQAGMELTAGGQPAQPAVPPPQVQQ